MIVLNIPYQNHMNKKIFDYISTCCSQQNNVNYAESIEDIEAKEDNHIYFCILNKKSICLFTSMSKKHEDNTFTPLIDIWVEIQDTFFDSLSDDCDNDLIFKFDIKKLFSTLSFSSNYKDRNIMQLCLSDDYSKIFYKISDTINVDLTLPVNERLKTRILNSFSYYDLKVKTVPTDVMDVTNVDKNSFLLPYFNHKDCLNFAVSSSENRTMLHSIDGNNYVTNILFNNDKVDYQSTTLLRKDKFKCFNINENVVAVSPGLWQLLVILQGSKVWNKLMVDARHADVYFGNYKIYHFFDGDAVYNYNNNINFDYLKGFMLVGKLHANEIFLLNKLFPNSKGSYFDFSAQKFVGTSYIFSGDLSNIKEKDNNVKEVDLTEKIDSELPLNLSFTELKHYIGGDLSQKDFVLRVYTNGTEVMLEKWNNQETVMETCVVFNHNMSKQYLGL